MYSTAIILFSALLLYVGIEAELEAYGTQRCAEFQCDPKSGLCYSRNLVCDQTPVCVNGYGSPESIEANCRPHCCDDEKILNVRTFGKLFNAYLVWDKSAKNCRDLNRKNALNAFDKSARPNQLATSCPDFQLVINISTALIPEWEVCFLRMKIDNFDTVDITVDNHPSKHIKVKPKPNTIRRLLNTTGNDIVIHFLSTRGNKLDCTYIVEDLEIVICPQTPASTVIPTTEAPTTAPITQGPSPACVINSTAIIFPVNDGVNECTSTESLTVNTCSGACDSITTGGTVISTNGKIPPRAVQKIQDCKCCNGNGTWSNFSVQCTNLLTGRPFTGVLSIFELTTCGCVPCIDALGRSPPVIHHPPAAHPPAGHAPAGHPPSSRPAGGHPPAGRPPAGHQPKQRFFN